MDQDALQHDTDSVMHITIHIGKFNSMCSDIIQYESDTQ